METIILTDEQIEQIATEIMSTIRTFDKGFDTKHGILLGMKKYRSLIKEKK